MESWSLRHAECQSPPEKGFDPESSELLMPLAPGDSPELDRPRTAESRFEKKLGDEDSEAAASLSSFSTSTLPLWADPRGDRRRAARRRPRIRPPSDATRRTTRHVGTSSGPGATKFYNFL